MRLKHLLLLALASVSVSCVSGPATAGSYRTGSDSRYVSEARSQNVLTHSQYEQNRRQRADVSEEMDLDEKKRRQSLAPLRTFTEGFNMVRSTGLVRTY